ncbi:allophanate hydrolase subunit 1 [Nocardioides sp. GCM10027113]|uniref:5-oxoprolinase subunit B family protein n=1 Tax=unclassified Nocardioides TaxID=2615069 RepID=UPI00361C5255
MDGIEIRTVGRSALLAEVADAAAARSLARWVRHLDLAVGEVVPAARTVLLDDVADPAALREVLAGWWPDAEPDAGELVVVEVRYDGPDLAFVAGLWGTDEAGVVERHTSVEYVADFCGFAPGFSYLSGLAEEWAVPRRETPRTRVPAGSVALAGAWCAAYPSASPGGWRLIGTTTARLWDPRRREPALLPPGTRVRFVPA